MWTPSEKSALKGEWVPCVMAGLQPLTLAYSSCSLYDLNVASFAFKHCFLQTATNILTVLTVNDNTYPKLHTQVLKLLPNVPPDSPGVFLVWNCFILNFFLLNCECELWFMRIRSLKSEHEINSSEPIAWDQERFRFYYPHFSSGVAVWKQTSPTTFSWKE